MDDVTLRYGGAELRLRKSREFVAVKPQHGIGREVLSQLVPNASAALTAEPTLGGFHLVNVAADETSASLASAGSSAQHVESALETLRQNPAIAVGTHVFESAGDRVPFVPTGQLFVECRKDASLEACQQLLRDHGLVIIEARGDREIIAQVTAASENPIKTAVALQKSPLIAIAEPDLATPGAIYAFSRPTDGRMTDQWHLRNRGKHRGTTVGFLAGADARVIDAWESAGTLGSPNVVVAVIDDGFDLSHPDLTGTWKIVAPKDFTRNSTSPVPDPLTQDWHGTACAGVAVGNADGTGIVGAAPRCRLMPVRWGQQLSDRELEGWFGYVREQGAWVVSCSWGAAARNFPLSTRASRAIERCAREGRNGLGTVICFAAGNENRDVAAPAHNSVNGFAIHPDVLAVAACTSRDERSHYSNFGDAIAVCAPSSGAGGWGITTSDVMGQYSRGSQTFEAGYSVGAYTDDFGGTSSACPLVAGVCALILSTYPDLGAADVRDCVKRSARKIGEASDYVDGHSRHFGYGCLDAAAALAEARGRSRQTSATSVLAAV